MNQLKSKIRFSSVASAIDLTPKAFRNWLQRYDLHLVSDHKTRGWTEFTLGDVAVLAVTRELVRWGVSVEYANEIAFTEINGRAGPLLDYRNTPAEALVAGLSPYVLVLWGHDENGDPVCATLREQEVEQLPREFPSYLFLHFGATVERAFQRMGSLTDGHQKVESV